MNVGIVYTEVDTWALSVRSLSAALRAHGHATKLLLMSSDTQVYSGHELATAGDVLHDCDLIGVSCLSRGSERTKRLIRSLQERGKTVIWGGVHATLNAEECAAVADMVCVGEGEAPLLDLLSRLERGDSWRDIPNLAYGCNGSFTMNPLRPLSQNMDLLPGPDWNCSFEYVLQGGQLLRRESVADTTSPGLMTFIGSRGCARHCTYCCNGRLKKIHEGCGPYLRRLSVERYVHLVDVMRHQCPDGKFFFFVDEDFFARPVQEIREFARLYSERVGLPFECCASAPAISEEKVRLLSGAGLWRVRIGVESGSDRTKRDIYRRTITNDAVLRASRIIAQHPRVSACYFIIIGNPFEEAEDLSATARFIAALPPGGTVWPFNLVFFPGSELYERAVEEGVIGGKESSGFDLDFRGGFDYKHLTWKHKNLYLNTLLFLMEGKLTRARLGLVPRFLLPPLLHPLAVRLNGRFTSPSRFLVALKTGLWAVRKWLVRHLKATLKHPTTLHHLKWSAGQRLRRGV